MGRSSVSSRLSSCTRAGIAQKGIPLSPRRASSGLTNSVRVVFIYAERTAKNNEGFT